MQARYVILRVLLEAGGGLVGVSGERVELDRAKILSVGRPAIAAFLQKLNVYKVPPATKHPKIVLAMVLRQLLIAQHSPKICKLLTRLDGPDGSAES
jgi:hypothetical protein